MSDRLDGAVLPAFYAAAAREHDIAAEQGGLVERNLRFGDRTVHVRIVGPDLAGVLLGAFAKRGGGSPGPGDASVAVWEAATCPAGVVPVPWDWADVGPGGLVRGPDAGGLVAVHETGSGALTLVEVSERAALHRVFDRSVVPWWDRAAPLRPALFWALGGVGRHLVHAGAVGDDRGGVLLVGARGAGKTTVVLAALHHGFDLIADDYALLRAGSEWEVVSVYGTVSVADAEAEPKTVLDVAASTPASLRESLPVRAVVAPRVRGGRARLRRVSPAFALRTWAPSTAFHMPFDGGAVVASLANIVRGVPCYTLDVGDDESELANAVDQVLDRAAT
jgi:hypothetical protein